MNQDQLLLRLLEESYERPAWHGPNLRQSIRGVSAKQAAWRPGPGRRNIWELTLHAAYWKYAVRRRIERGKRGAFVLKGSNFFSRPEPGKLTETAWRADRDLLEREHCALCGGVRNAQRKGLSAKLLREIYGVCFHDIYHAGQIRLLRRLQEERGKK